MQATIKCIYTTPRKVCQKVPATSWTNALYWALDLHQLNPQSNTTEHTVASPSSSYPWQRRSSVGGGLVVWRSLGTSHIQVCSTPQLSSNQAQRQQPQMGCGGRPHSSATYFTYPSVGLPSLKRYLKARKPMSWGSSQISGARPGLGWIQSS